MGMRGDRRHGQPEQAGAILKGLLTRLGLQERLEQRCLLEAWPQVVGEKIARFSRAIDLQDGVLLLQADNAVWRQELTLLLPTIMEKYNERYGAGTIKEIRWDRRLPRGRSRDHVR
jgi:predicted nucleic acid-binding Zn ribbon protein